MMKLTNWDPIALVSTLASFTSHILRCDHLPPKSLCNLPENGFSNNRQQSMHAIKWIEWLAQSNGFFIQHANNGGERRVSVPGETPVFVDGFAVGTDGAITIYEYFGCYWHGCPRCFSPRELNVVCQQPFATLYASTMERVRKLSSAYTLEFVWECEVKRQLRKDTAMKTFFNNYQVTRLVLRSAMQGGRTESHAVLADSNDDMKIVYLDVNSLYPTVMSTAELPIGNPKIIKSGFPSTPASEFKWRGLGHVSVLAPRTLRYPVLGIKMNNTLLFALCRSCGSTKASTRCMHSESERTLMGTWTHSEINKALSLGYTIVKFYEVWEWENFSSSLFKKYVKTFYTIKTRCSGWPHWVSTDRDKQTCLAHYKATMDIDLAAEEIEDNAALRSVSKLLLNTSWGKFAQNPFHTNTIICDGDGFVNVMDTKQSKISSYKKFGDDLYLVTLRDTPEEVHSSINGNLPLAIFITSEARLILYAMLEKSEGRALYTDTDSVIALVPRNRNPFASMTGDGLGLLTDETPGREIESAIFAGPKQYALKMRNLVTGEITYTIKIRGLTLDSDARETIDFEKMALLVTDRTEFVDTVRLNLRRSIPYVTTEPQVKRYRPVNEKGVTIVGHVYPYGYHAPE